MNYFYFLAILVLIHSNAWSQNVLISDQNYPNETSIIIDPKNPNVLIAGANIDNYYISLDTGRTWTSHILNSNFGVWGDPVLAVDTASNFYYFHLSNPPSGNWIDRIVCQKSTDNGISWTNGSFTGLNGSKAQDKQWCAIDRTNNNMYLTWTQFDNYGSTNVQDSSIILFSKSLDSGNTWSQPKRINKKAGDCVDSDNTVEGAVPAVGPNGEIYVSWAGPNGLVFNKSLDQGETWLNSEITIDPFVGGWDYSISGMVRANGLPITACDLSNGPNHGTIYVNWSDQRNGINNTDIWLIKSNDGGQTWSEPVKVNDDTSNKQQFFTWMTIDQTTGYLYFVFYDRRNYNNNNNTDVYLAVSTDGGNSFINRKISETPFSPIIDVFFGDYTNIVAHNGIVRPIWTRLHNGNLSIWTDLVNLDDILSPVEEINAPNNSLAFENYPNPTNNEAFISFKLHKETKVNLAVYGQDGKKIMQIIENENRRYGKYVERINFDKLNLPAGTYILRLELDKQLKTERQVFLK